MNHTRTTTSIHLHGPLATAVKYFAHGNSVTGEIYGRASVSAGQSELTLYIEDSAQAQALAAAFGELAADLAIAEVGRDNALAAAEAAKQAAAEADEAARQQNDDTHQARPPRVCCSSDQGYPHAEDCAGQEPAARPLFHMARADLAVLMASGDPEAQAEWLVREQVAADTSRAALKRAQ